MTASGVRDIGVRGGRIAAIGNLVAASAGEMIDAKGLHVLPGVIDTPGAFPRAGPGAQGRPGDRQPRRRDRRRHGRVRDAQHQAADDHGRRRWPTRCARARNRMFCDFAFYVGGTRENIDDIPELEQLEGSAGIKVFMGSSTGDLLVDDEAFARRASSRQHLAPRRLPRRGRGAAEGAHAPAQAGRSVLASRVARRARRR